jgi:hypothetical protein
MSAQPLPTYATECLLCHRKQQNPPLNIPLVGKPGKHVEEFLKKLLVHVGAKHTKEMELGGQLLQQYQAFLLLSQFESEDPSVQQLLEMIRAQVFMRSRRNVPTDADLETLAANCTFETERDYKKAYDAMRAIRDLCCELGAAAPKFPEEAKVIVPVG